MIQRDVLHRALQSVCPLAPPVQEDAAAICLSIALTVLPALDTAIQQACPHVETLEQRTRLALRVLRTLDAALVHGPEAP